MHGGRVLRFEEIEALLQEAASMQHGGMHGHLSDDAHGAHGALSPGSDDQSSDTCEVTQ